MMYISKGNKYEINDLERFVIAQKNTYSKAKKELLNGKKSSHWMWYIFPQIRGLGMFDMSCYYGVSGLEEAKKYFEHKILGKHLIELCNILLSLEENDVLMIFGYPDNRKLKSCMTLFYLATNEKIFQDVLDKFFSGLLDRKTINLVKAYIDK